MNNSYTHRTSAPFLGVMMTAALLCSATPAHAISKLYSPYVEQGELELEYFGRRSVDDDASKNNAQKQEVALGYGVNAWWKTELYAIFEKDAQEDMVFDAWEWENIFQLTDRGEYWLDVGASLAYEMTPESSRADAIEARLLLAKDWENTSHIFNVITEKQIGSGPKEELEGKLLWSSRYTYARYFEPGFEYYSDLGELEDSGSFDEQKHYVGPSAYGKIPLGFTDRADALKYRIGYFFGISDAASDGQAVAQLEYELHF